MSVRGGSQARVNSADLCKISIDSPMVKRLSQLHPPIETVNAKMITSKIGLFTFVIVLPFRSAQD